jgi:hypothetical protein
VVKNSDTALADNLKQEAASLEKAGKWPEAVVKYQQSIAVRPDPSVDQKVAVIQSQIGENRKRTETAEALWLNGLILAQSGKTTEALPLLRDSLMLTSTPARVQFVQVLGTKAVAAREAEAKPLVAAESKPVGLTGSSWKGVILIQGKSGTTQWPLQASILKDNTISSVYRIPAADGKTYDVRVFGKLQPDSGRVDINLSCFQGSIDMIRFSMTGNLRSETSAGGEAKITLTRLDQGLGKGIWRMMRSP